MWVPIVLENRERSIAGAGADFQECGRRRISGGDLGENGEFLLQPLAVFEEVCSVVFVEIVPPFGGVGIKSIF